MTTPTDRTPVALSIAGSDSSGGAGIQADLKTFTALGMYGATVLTALTAQNTCGVRSVHIPSARFVGEQMDAVFADLNVKAAKTGMLATAEIIDGVANAMAHRPDVALIVDPVMIATSGDPLIAPDAIAAMRDVLLPLATLTTPNINEAAALLNRPAALTETEMVEQARLIVERGCRAVLIKGGHLKSEHGRARDVLVSRGAPEPVWFEGPWIETTNTHGTGCTLSAAITAFLVLGDDLEAAIGAGKRYLTHALAAGASKRVGHGHGPPDHLFAIRVEKDD
ncbi:MAG: bifunctional hydroxymethylpyrimidine kinase/phosphomethylpyrimidine kinase [Hyphomicrobiaceae bacterium]